MTKRTAVKWLRHLFTLSGGLMGPKHIDSDVYRWAYGERLPDTGKKAAAWFRELADALEKK